MNLDVNNMQNWGEGPWLKEPGMEAVVEYNYKGFECLLRRSPVSGAWLAYVAIPLDSKWSNSILSDDLKVHGGITWNYSGLPFSHSKEENKHWLGFDCAHYGDYWPRYRALMKSTAEIARFEDIPEVKQFSDLITSFRKPTSPREEGEVYRTLSFAKTQLRKLINQIEDKNGIN